ncbi:MAG TPA: T9SS type A sorting domain-containing protein [Cyclobacteriaceae bacterium]|nr:T9SS type A sorting domain-containing protein [Cyclobacteriaceae bacterium]
MLKTVNPIRPVILLWLLAMSGLSGHALASDITISLSGSNPYCAGAPVTITYSSSSLTFNSGNIFTAQLSDASGSFAAPTTIGTLTSTASSGTIDVTLPANASGSAYKIRVASSDEPFVGSPNGGDIIINATIATSVSITAPNGNILCDTHDANFQATSTGGGTSPTYQWHRNGNPAGSNSSIFNGTGLEDGDQIMCKMTSNASCPVDLVTSSNIITIIRKTTAAPSVTILAPPIVCSGVTTEFSAQPTNGGTAPTYQWKKNGVDVGINSFKYSDNTLQTSDVLSLTMTSNRECLSTPTANESLDLTVTTSVTPTLKIAVTPSTLIGPGSVVYLSSTITDGGTAPAFEWKKNSTVIGTTNAFSISSLVNGDIITAKMTSNASCAQPALVTSNEIVMAFDNTLTKTGHAWESRTAQADVSGVIARVNGSGFSIGSKGYIGLGSVTVASTTTYRKDFWEYDPQNDVWTQKADFPGVGRINAVGFSVGTKGYFGTGLSATGVKKDLWQYDPTTNLWTQRADYPGQAREQAFAFNIGNRGYVGGGFSNGVGDFKDFFEFDPAANMWTARADFGGGKRMGAATFAIDQKGYVATGYSSSTSEWFKDLWDFDPGQNIWTKRADLPGNGRTQATGFSFAGSGYVGLGYSGSGYEGQFFQYTVTTNSWSVKPYYPGPATNNSATGMSIGNRAYVYKDGKWWEYSFLTIGSFSSKFCSTENAGVTWDASGFIFGANNVFTAQISPMPNFSVTTTLATVQSQASTGTFSVTMPGSVSSGSYFFRVISSNPVVSTMLERITVTALPPVHTITVEPGATVCKDTPASFTSNLTGPGFQWFRNTLAVGTDSPSYSESSLVTGDVIKAVRYYSDGCKSTVGLNSNSITMTVKAPAKPVITVVPNTLQSTPAIAYQWFLDGNAITGATAQSYIMAKNGAYKVRTSDNGGCFSFSDEVVNVYVGLDDESVDEQISIFPNPVVNEMRLEIAGDLVGKGVNYSVIDELGHPVVGTQPAERINKINLSGRSSGLYMLRLSLNGETIVRRIIKVE